MWAIRQRRKWYREVFTMSSLLWKGISQRLVYTPIENHSLQFCLFALCGRWNFSLPSQQPITRKGSFSSCTSLERTCVQLRVCTSTIRTKIRQIWKNDGGGLNDDKGNCPIKSIISAYVKRPSLRVFRIKGNWIWRHKWTRRQIRTQNTHLPPLSRWHKCPTVWTVFLVMKFNCCYVLQCHQRRAV